MHGARNVSGGLYKVHIEVLIPSNKVGVNIAAVSDSILELCHSARDTII